MVHLGHLELRVEVRHRPQALHDDPDAAASRVVDEEPAKRIHLGVRESHNGLFEHGRPLLGREQGRLPRVLKHRNHHGVEAPGGAGDDIEMPVGYRIERPGTQGRKPHPLRPPGFSLGLEHEDYRVAVGKLPLDAPV